MLFKATSFQLTSTYIFILLPMMSVCILLVLEVGNGEALSMGLIAWISFNEVADNNKL